MKIKIQVLIITMFVLSLSSFVFAQDFKGVQLNNGTLIYGKVTKLNTDQVIIEKNDGNKVYVKWDDVAQFLKDDQTESNDEGLYISGNIGIAVLSDSDLTDSTAPGVVLELESDMGVALGMALGYSFSNDTRVEGEFAYQKNDVDSISFLGFGVPVAGDTSSLAFLLNGYYDFVNNGALTPFISIGFGLANVEVDDTTTTEDDTVFAYQVGAGIGYAITEKVTLDFKYRFFGTSDPEFGTVTAEYLSHNLYFGIRHSF